MFDATKLLGAMLENRAAPSAGSRVQHAIQDADAPGAPAGAQAGAPAGGGIGGMLSGLLGGAGRPGGGGLDLNALLGQVGAMARQATRDPVGEVRGNNPVAVGGLGALAGALLGRGSAGTAATGGLVAVLGSLAWKALQAQGQGQGQGQGSAQAQAGAAGQITGPDLPQTEDDLQHESRLMLRAIVQAAQADGRIDEAEIRHIVTKLEQSGQDAEARAYVEQLMMQAPDVAALARDVRSPAQAARIYAASLLAIEVDTDAEREHLARLAAALRLPAEAVARIHLGLGVAA